MDIAWRDDTMFATSSADKMIYLCQLGSPVPLRQYAGHENEVNAIRWDPSGKYLASCSDDRSVKVWGLESNTCLVDLRGHSSEVYTLAWYLPRTASHPEGSLLFTYALFYHLTRSDSFIEPRLTGQSSCGILEKANASKHWKAILRISFQ